ncbi:hypothetical protein K227x_23690 [Rubripirellula lacrimiformis]|uniref:Thioredoxin domain-containing protein n=1 Tax=Rubripirellula lacrimiformis TaxID=1930273 RepID=A0A517NA25_9BACT|nr:hypothetical protein [Rubripirellula lacrimiformis]QDT03983.1 hypothetical protein K227x_23690 [Rubripirellula lacrimiformis]
MNRLTALSLLLAFSTQVALSQYRSVFGHVGDSDEKPVDNASVSTFWSANGSQRQSDGTAFDWNWDRRSKFEVIGVCIDWSGEIDDVSKLDKALSAIEANVWNGKKIPFPIVLDTTFNTWERYGIPGLGTVVLIDPDGRIAEGDESTLQLILDQADP